MDIIGKPKSLSKSFWHKFVPNSNKLFAPRNIKFEIWDLSTLKIVDKWHPELFCISRCVFNKSGTRFALLGGCKWNESEIKIYDVFTLEAIKSFWLPEKVRNIIFDLDDDSLFAGTSEGNFYKFDINSDILYDERKEDEDIYYSISDKNKILYIDHSIISFAESEAGTNDVFFVISPVIDETITGLEKTKDYILIYNVKSQIQQEIVIPLKDTWDVAGIKYRNGKLAILTKSYGGKENDCIFFYANFYIYELESGILTIIKEGFKLPDVFSNMEVFSWATDRLIAVISLDEVLIFDILNNNLILQIGFSKPRSVEFSNDGKTLAVGGDKAKLYKFS